MKIRVYDTHVKIPDGSVMNFKVLIDNKNGNGAGIEAREGVEKYVNSTGQEYAKCNTQDCWFLDIQKANKEQEEVIQKKGYYIIKIDNCP